MKDRLYYGDQSHVYQIQIIYTFILDKRSY